MKKLMIAAAIVCAAAFAQAGTVAWKSAYLNVFGQSGDTAEVVDGSTVYLMNAGTTTQAAFINALVEAGDNWQTEFGSQVAGALNYATQGEKKLASPHVGAMDGNYAKFDTDASNLALYMVMLDSGNDAVYVSELVSADIKSVGDTNFSFTHGGAGEGNIFKMADGFSDGGYYTAAAVPEPTSGLLLLLGVAGLALKRRRA